jgi:uncharacterized protein involved in exopolysaccharide biosynthesis
MVSDEDFRALLARVEQLEQIVPGIDRDVATIQAQRRADLELLMALRGTQLEQGLQIADLRGDVSELGREVSELGREVRAGFSGLTTLLRRPQPGGE